MLASKPAARELRCVGPALASGGLLAAQADALREAGLLVKNTFIDIPDGSCDHALHKRARSAPPAQGPKAGGAEVCRHGAETSLVCTHQGWTGLVGGEPRSSPLSSTTCSESGDFAVDRCSEFSEEATTDPCSFSRNTSKFSTATKGSLPSISDVDVQSKHLSSTEDCGADLQKAGAASKLAALVERECGFLHISGFLLHGPARPPSCKKGSRKYEMPCLRVFVRGLPWVKRAKWQQPLNWAVAAVLQRAGCSASVRRGELVAQWGEGTDAAVRIEFSASRDETVQSSASTEPVCNI